MSKQREALKMALDYLMSKKMGAHIIDVIREGLAEPEHELNQREFMQQYVLQRCVGNTGAMDGRQVAHEAMLAYQYIEEVTK